ncbi:class I SAM-dependent methyltransferase [Candidatus Woesearchaeota archaeon]|nr:class I SAM-dependent methyltransferase [Candidatus Woesearchaeota archaeon]
MGMLKILKKMPIDAGQETLRHKTKGKLMALKAIKTAIKGQTALDVGCREGIQSKWLESKGYKVTSIDIEKAYEKCIIADCNKKLPFKSNSFDLAWCSEVIEHLDNPEKSVNEMRRVLKPGGIMIITTPNSRCLIYRLLSAFGMPPQKVQNPEHKHFFGEKDVRNLFPKAKILGFFPYMIYKAAIRKNLNFLTPTFVIIERK